MSIFLFEKVDNLLSAFDQDKETLSYSFRTLDLSRDFESFFIERKKCFLI